MISPLQETKHVFQKVYAREPFLKCLSCAIIPGVLLYTIVFLVLKSFGFTTIEIIRDPAQLNESSSFLGLISNLGNAFWISSAAIALFTAFTSGSIFSKPRRELLILAGLLSLLLGVDDFFMLHDRYIKQNACYATYAILAITLLLRHYRMILKNYATAFFFAGTFLALSILVDLRQGAIPMSYDKLQIIEEGFKFVGAFVWLYFVGVVAAKEPEEEEPT
jgi:hypothetical protein